MFGSVFPCSSVADLLATCCRTGARNDSENLLLAHNQELFSVDHDFRTAVLAKEDPVALLNIQWLPRTVFLIFSRSDRDYLALLRFLFGAVRNNNAAANLLAFINALYDQAVM